MESADDNSKSAEPSSNADPVEGFSLHGFVEDNAGWLTLLSFSGLFVSVFFGMASDGCISSNHCEDPSKIFIGLFLVLSVATAILAFTRPVASTRKNNSDISKKNRNAETACTCNCENECQCVCKTAVYDDDDVNNSALNVIFRIGYGFIFVVLVSCGLVFFVEEPIFFGKTAKNDSIHYSLAILPGCDYAHPGSVAADDNDKSNAKEPSDGSIVKQGGMPPNAHCGDIPPQWVISIGGAVLSCHITGDCSTKALDNEQFQVQTQRRRQLEREVEKYSRQYSQCSTILQRYQHEFDHAKVLSHLDPFNRKLEKRISSLETKIQTKEDECSGLKSSLDAKTIERAHQSKELDVNEKIANRTLAQPIVGGLVVPLYFVVLAILGGLVSFMRKLPEYQRRASLAYHRSFKNDPKTRNEDEPPITPTQAREYVIFQILQSVSAPLIALVAYSWAKPDQIAASSLLAFSAGFSSELILIAIRSGVDRLLGQGLRVGRVRLEMQKELGEKEVKKELAKVKSSIERLAPSDFISFLPFKPGDKVVLQQAVEIFKAGDPGMVSQVHTDGTVSVNVTATRGGKEQSKIIRKGVDFFVARDTSADETPRG